MAEAVDHPCLALVEAVEDLTMLEVVVGEVEERMKSLAVEAPHVCWRVARGGGDCEMEAEAEAVPDWERHCLCLELSAATLEVLH